MTREYAALSHKPLAAGAHVASVQPPARLTLESPAIEAMTDLRKVAASTVSTDRSIEDCNAFMMNSRSRSQNIASHCDDAFKLDSMHSG